MKKPLRLLNIEDSTGDAQLIIRALSKGGYDVTSKQVDTADEMRAALRDEQWDVVISDYAMPRFSGYAALALLQELEMDIPFIVVSGTMGEDTAVEMMRAGAQDYIMKNNLARLAVSVERELAQAEERRQRRRSQQDLKESERFAHATVDALSSHIAILDENGTIITVNKAWREFAGKNSAALLNCAEGANYLAVCDAASGNESAHASAMAQGIRDIMSKQQKEFLLEYPCHSPNEQRWFVARVTRFSGEGPLRVVVAHENITQRKLAETALQQSEVHYRELFDANPHPMWVYDLATLRFLSVNDTAVKKYGYSRSEFLSMTIKDIRPEEDLVRLEKDLLQPAETIENSGVWRHRLKDGTIVYVEIVSHAFTVEGRSARLVLANDVTERLKVEKALRESEERLRLSLTSGKLGLYDLNVQTGETIVNAEYAAMLGYDPKTFVETNNLWIDRLHPDDKARAVQVYDNYIAGMIKDYKVEFRQRAADGNWKWILSHGKITEYDWDGKPLRMLGTHTDITEIKQVEESLIQSEQLFRSVWDNSASGMRLTDERGIVVNVNDAYCRIMGKRKDEIIGFSLASVYRKEDINRIIQKHQSNFRSRNVPLYIEREMVLSNGNRIWVEVSNSFIDMEGKKPLLLGVFTDISDRKRAEEMRLLQTTALESAANGIVITTLDGTIVWANKAFTRITGYSLDEVINQNPRILKSGVQSAEYYRNLWETILAGSVWTGEIVNKRKDGTLYTDEMTITPVRDSNNVITHFVTVKQDVTERNKAFEQIERQAMLLNEAHDAIVVRDLDHKILYWNKGAERMYGWAADEVIGKDARTLFFDDPRKHNDMFDQLRQKGDFTGELIHKTKDRNDIAVNVRLTVVKDARGNPASILSIVTDITEKKKMEAQFLRSQRLDSLGTLAGGIAHDLNNVIAPILLSIEILKKTYVDERATKIISALESSARRGSDIVKQILVFARGLESKKTVIQSRHLIREIFLIFKETFPRSITLNNEVSNTVAPILADPTHFQQVIMNLCVNARDAMPNGGTLTIDAENRTIDEQYSRLNIQAKPGRYVMFSISDTGIGMSAEVMDKIFDPFFTTKEVGKGTGLGLSTVHTIVKNHGGFIETKSEIGKGTTFNVYFPAAEEGGEVVSEKEIKDRFAGSGELILVVDDETSVLEVTRQTLESFNYKVVTAANGVEALTVFASRPAEIALVVSDMMMPLMDGPQLILAVRKMKPAVKVIGSSGLVEKGKINKDDLGINAFLLKPYSAEDLLKIIKEVLSQK